MALMTDIRNNMAKLFAVLAVLFIIMIVFDWGLDLSGRKGRSQGNMEIIGSVNGQEIDYREFSDLVRRAEENQKKQSGADVDDETDRQIRSQVWNQLVSDMLIDQEIKRLGITVTDQEVVDIVRGPNPPDFLVAQFRDSTGTFRRDAYERAMMDPQNRTAWLQVEDAIREDQKRRKLQSLLMATVRVTDDEAWDVFTDRTLTLDAEYALFDANRLVSDSAVTVTDDDLRRQYDSHPEDFKAKASRKLKYVTFSLAASADDSSQVEQEMAKLREQAVSGSVDFVELAKTYSDVPVTEAYFNRSELSPAKESAVFAAKKGEIVGPIRDADGIHLIKVLDSREGKNDFIRVSHILINAVSGPDSVKAIQKARDLAREARNGADFATLARQNSQDYGSAMQGGDLGWNGRGRWVKPFEDAAFKARVGEIVGPIRTQFGWHILKVTGRDRREVKIASLTMKVKASAQTTDLAYKQAEDFSYLAKDEGFDKSAELSKYQVRETPEFTKGGMVPGIGYNESVNTYAFANKEGAISNPMAVTGGVAVFMVSGVREEGLRPFEEVKGILQTMALRQKKMDVVRKMAEEFAKSLTPSADLAAAARSNPYAMVQTTGPFKPADAPSGIGRDLKFIGTAMAMKPGEISQPFEGLRGYYILKLLSRSTLDSSQFAIEKEGIRNQILQDKRSRLLTEWQNQLREKADIVDHRDKFYR